MGLGKVRWRGCREVRMSRVRKRGWDSREMVAAEGDGYHGKLRAWWGTRESDGMCGSGAQPTLTIFF